MKPPVETVRISKQGRDQLIKVRRQTGIEHWNILCRWALVTSLRERAAAPMIRQKLEGGVEMTWKVFAGEESDILCAAVRIRAIKDDFGNDQEAFSQCLRAHLHRGLSYLSSGTGVKTICDFYDRWSK